MFPINQALLDLRLTVLDNSRPNLLNEQDVSQVKSLDLSDAVLRRFLKEESTTHNNKNRHLASLDETEYCERDFAKVAKNVAQEQDAANKNMTAANARQAVLLT